MDTNTEYRTLDVLIIEDEIDICYLLSSLLKRKKLKPSFVTSLHAAKDELNKICPHILFIDNHLPDGYGIDFISEVKKVHPQIKIVMITAHDTGDDKQRALTQGADYFIGKPFTSNKIFETVDVLLQTIQ